MSILNNRNCVETFASFHNHEKDRMIHTGLVGRAIINAACVYQLLSQRQNCPRTFREEKTKLDTGEQFLKTLDVDLYPDTVSLKMHGNSYLSCEHNVFLVTLS